MAHLRHSDLLRLVFFGQTISALSVQKSGGCNYNAQRKGKCWHWAEKQGVIELIFPYLQKSKEPRRVPYFPRQKVRLLTEKVNPPPETVFF